MLLTWELNHACDGLGSACSGPVCQVRSSISPKLARLTEFQIGQPMPHEVPSRPWQKVGVEGGEAEFTQNMQTLVCIALNLYDSRSCYRLLIKALQAAA